MNKLFRIIAIIVPIIIMSGMIFMNQTNSIHESDVELIMYLDRLDKNNNKISLSLKQGTTDSFPELFARNDISLDEGDYQIRSKEFYAMLEKSSPSSTKYDTIGILYDDERSVTNYNYLKVKLDNYNFVEDEFNKQPEIELRLPYYIISMPITQEDVIEISQNDNLYTEVKTRGFIVNGTYVLKEVEIHGKWYNRF